MGAGFEVKGMDATIALFTRAAACSEDAVKQAVKAGGKLVAEKLREKAPVDTGALQRSVKPGPVKYSAAEGYYCEVKPTGNHPKTGEPLAKVGNILEYGRSNMAPRAWFHPTVEAAQGEAMQAMQEALDARMGGATR